MKLGLITYNKPFTQDDGTVRLDGKDTKVADLDSGVEVENVVGMIWGPLGKLLMEPNAEEALFTKEHFDLDKDYLVIVVECAEAENRRIR